MLGRKNYEVCMYARFAWMDVTFKQVLGRLAYSVTGCIITICCFSITSCECSTTQKKVVVIHVLLRQLMLKWSKCCEKALGADACTAVLTPTRMYV